MVYHANEKTNLKIKLPIQEVKFVKHIILLAYVSCKLVMTETQVNVYSI